MLMEGAGAGLLNSCGMNVAYELFRKNCIPIRQDTEVKYININKAASRKGRQLC